MTEEDYADFEKSTKSWICKDSFEEGDVKVKYQNWKIPKKIPRSRVHQNLSLTKKIPITFHNLQNYDSHLIFQEVERFNFKINVVPKNKRKMHELYYRTT